MEPVTVALGALSWSLLSSQLGAATGAGSDDSGAWFGVGAVSYSQQVQRFAQAIAWAEGYYSRNAQVIPRKNHNPGDLKLSSVPNVGSDAQGHLIFATDGDGWEALHRQVQLIVDGRSLVYNLNMTIAEMGAKYAEGSANWTANVCKQLRVPADTVLREVLV